jgi:hypothetical protein
LEKWKNIQNLILQLPVVERSALRKVVLLRWSVRAGSVPGGAFATSFQYLNLNQIDVGSCHCG